MKKLIAHLACAFLSLSLIQAQSDFSPIYSPNGKQIAFYRYVNKVPELMIMDSNGEHLYQLTKTTGLWSIGPSWSKNGQSIYFSQGEGMAGLDVSVIDIKSREVQRTEMEGMQFSFGETKKGFMWASKGVDGMRFYEAKGMHLKDSRTILVAGFANYSIVSHRGKDLFFAVKDEGKEGIYIKKGSSAPKRISAHKKPQNISISSNGKLVLFESAVDGNSDIYMVKTDGTDLQRLTTDESPDYMPGFSPDGKSIVFSSARSGAFYLYIMDLKTREITQITGK